MSANIPARSRYILPLISLVCAAISAYVIVYYVLTAKQGDRHIKATYIDRASCRPPTAYGSVEAAPDHEQTEIFFAGCSGYF